MFCAAEDRTRPVRAVNVAAGWVSVCGAHSGAAGPAEDARTKSGSHLTSSPLLSLSSPPPHPSFGVPDTANMIVLGVALVLFFSGTSPLSPLSPGQVFVSTERREMEEVKSHFICSLLLQSKDTSPPLPPLPPSLRALLLFWFISRSWSLSDGNKCFLSLLHSTFQQSETNFTRLSLTVLILKYHLCCCLSVSGS